MLNPTSPLSRLTIIGLADAIGVEEKRLRQHRIAGQEHTVPAEHGNRIDGHQHCQMHSPGLEARGIHPQKGDSQHQSYTNRQIGLHKSQLTMEDGADDEAQDHADTA